MKFEYVVKQLHKIEARAPDIFRSLFLDSEHCYWLDSSRSDEIYGRYSFMGDGNGPYAHVVHQRVGEMTIQYSPSEGETAFDQDIFTFLETKLNNFELKNPPSFGFDFLGGYVGYFGYELMAITENVQGKRSTLPDAQMLFSDRFIAIDHIEQTIYLVALHQEQPAPAEAWVDDMARKIMSISSNSSPRRIDICHPDAIERYLLHDKNKYLAQINSCKEEIEAGESYEVCLTNRVRADLQEYDSKSLFDSYLVLREINPAPYAYFFKTMEYSILCSSPERFLKIDRQLNVEARPIKGTMPRDADPTRDAENKAKLGCDKRFFSEHLMIVDLLRNDLSRTCVPGTVSVSELMKIESYATLHQLVSTIRGKLEGGILQCIAQCFPGGSMTGAPKRRTLEIINEIEDVPRGIYSGAIGYLSLNRTADLNIAIRTIVIHDNVADIGVGGAITYLSNPQQEYDEMILKALAPFSAIRHMIKRTDDGDSLHEGERSQGYTLQESLTVSE